MVPTVHLHSVFRQAATSSVVVNAHCVNKGKVPASHLWAVDMATVPGYTGRLASSRLPASRYLVRFPGSILSVFSLDSGHLHLLEGFARPSCRSLLPTTGPVHLGLLPLMVPYILCNLACDVCKFQGMR